MRRPSILRLGFPEQLTSRRDHLRRTGDHIGHLKAHAGPGTLSLAAAMDADDPSL